MEQMQPQPADPNPQFDPAAPPPQQPSQLMRILAALFRTGVGFLKAQLIMLGVNMLLITVGMLIVGMRWCSPLIAVGVALLDMLPVIGSGIAFIPWTVAAFIAGNTRMALGVGLTYIAMVVVRMVLDPIVTGKNIGLSPLITLASAVLGMLLFGSVGLIVGPAIAAVANVVYRVLFESKPRA